jgi:hypothetical protein
MNFSLINIMEIMNPFEFAMTMGQREIARGLDFPRHPASYKTSYAQEVSGLTPEEWEQLPGVKPTEKMKALAILQRMGPKPATEFEKLQCKIMDLEEELVRVRNENTILKDSLDYMPDMPGYHRAKESFEASSKCDLAL